MTGGRIRTLLIANRGEIAIRIMRTAQRMGIRTVAVFSDADERAWHVAHADRAVRIGPAAALQSYLDIDAIICAGRAAGADAVHPGYGFLAENADFAEACAANGMTFIGPPPSAIRAMGDKANARTLMARSNVPLLPGYHGDDKSLPALADAAASIGFPLLIKPSAGGGGRGMRVVDAPADFKDALRSARREASSAFGDDRVILEKFLRKARHVEVQVFADAGGRTVHLHDRDCSAQRRRQKLVEEAPAPGLPDVLRAGLHGAAITCAKAISYVGAGTVEFLVGHDSFYFMEMNTRLQVEHPVTEAITGIDLVAWQIRVAQGEPLPLSQEDILASGHAIEARIYAESPAEGFLPQTGQLTCLRWPADLDGVRIDAGVREGEEVSPHYDALLAKIVAHGRDRAEALARLYAAISRTAIAGVDTNRSFLLRVLSHPDFVEGRHDTGFVEANAGGLILDDPTPSPPVLCIAAFAALHRIQNAVAAMRKEPTDPHSPWNDRTGWRLGGRAALELRLASRNSTTVVAVRWRSDGYEMIIESRAYPVTGVIGARGEFTARVLDEQVHGVVAFGDERLTLFIADEEFTFTVLDPTRPQVPREDRAGILSAPMPGRVIAVMIEAGAAVERESPLVVIEAMKMEHTITAPRSGRIKAVRVALGDQVAAGAEVVVMEDEP